MFLHGEAVHGWSGDDFGGAVHGQQVADHAGGDDGPVARGGGVQAVLRQGQERVSSVTAFRAKSALNYGDFCVAHGIYTLS